MAQIVKFPVQASKFGYKRVKRRAKASDHPDQLHLSLEPTARILSFAPEQGWFEHALFLDERGDSKAAEFYRKAIDEQDCIADACCNLGIIESQKGDTTRAFDCFTESLKHNPRHAESHFNLGNLYFDLNDFRLAQVHYEMAAQVDPTFVNVYFNLALVQAINNELSAAVSTLATYKSMVSAEEGRIADELLDNLKKSVIAARNPRAGST